MNLKDEITKLKEEKDMVILAHNYQLPEIQDVADHLGDSLELCYLAQKLEAGIIVFAGVKFMAESALILNPKKTILLSHPEAYCPMAEMLTPEIIKEKKRDYPDAAVVLYGNTTAMAKAEADAICTSANSPKVVNSFNEDQILFGPDKNLRHWTQGQTDKELMPVPDSGYCYVHNSLITLADIMEIKMEHPSAEVLVHPECVPEVQDAADGILSTNGMLDYTMESNAKEFIIGTEKEMCYRLAKELPGKKFYPINKAICEDMKKTDLRTLYDVMLNEKNKMTLPDEIIKRSQKALQRMLDIGR